MKKSALLLLGTLLLSLIIGGLYVYAPSATEVSYDPQPVKELRVTALPEKAEQGEPVLLIIEGLSSTSAIRSFTFDGRPINTFIYEGQVTSIIAIDLYAKTGTFPIVLELKDGRKIESSFVIEPRPVVQRAYDIPEKLGGNTPESISALIKTLAEEGKIINSLPLKTKMAWTESFRSPLDNMVLDDPYGYTRVIAGFSMPHKGTDLVADIGVPVYAVNDGTVRLATELRNYGKTVIIDHGEAIQSVYMHLSRIDVEDERKVRKGDVIGLTGDSGYADHPHLHFSIRIWEVSIDPLKFLSLLGE